MSNLIPALAQFYQKSLGKTYVGAVPNKLQIDQLAYRVVHQFMGQRLPLSDVPDVTGYLAQDLQEAATRHLPLRSYESIHQIVDRIVTEGTEFRLDVSSWFFPQPRFMSSGGRRSLRVAEDDLYVCDRYCQSPFISGLRFWLREETDDQVFSFALGVRIAFFDTDVMGYEVGLMRQVTFGVEGEAKDLLKWTVTSARKESNDWKYAEAQVNFSKVWKGLTENKRQEPMQFSEAFYSSELNDNRSTRKLGEIALILKGLSYLYPRWVRLFFSVADA